MWGMLKNSGGGYLLLWICVSPKRMEESRRLLYRVKNMILSLKLCLFGQNRHIFFFSHKSQNVPLFLVVVMQGDVINCLIKDIGMDILGLMVFFFLFSSAFNLGAAGPVQNYNKKSRGENGDF